ncbi:MAG TPA: nucleotidyltransferase family protein [Bacillota bacterium]
MYAVILAGAEGISGTGELSYKAGLSLGNDTMLGKVIDVVSKIKSVERIVVVGAESLLKEKERKKVWRIIAPGKSFFANLEQGILSIPGEEEVLVVASDLPLITSQACADFITKCRSRQADVYYPVIPKELYENAYPGSERTYIKLSDGVYTGGNMVLMKTSFFRRHRKLIRLAINLRKRPWILALYFGLGFWGKFARKSLTINDIEEIIKKKYKFRGAAIISHYSELGFDIDSQEDLNWIRFYWAGIRDGWKRELEKDEWLM